MDERTRDPLQIRAEDINPRYNWGRAPPSLGIMGVDFEERVDYRRLHRYRIARAQQALENSELGALLVFDVNNIRYITSTKIGEWERDKLARWALLTRTGEPILWDFGSAAVHHKLYAPWLAPENCKAGLVGLRGTVAPAFGLMKKHAEELASILREHGVADMPIGVDIIEPPMMFELEKAGLKIADGQQVMLEAREIKSQDEIALLNHAAAMVDAAGVSVTAMRYQALALNGVLASMAGSYLVLAQNPNFIPNMTAGRGYMALAAMIFGKWHPVGALWACLLFGFLDAIGIRLQGVALPDLLGGGAVPVQAIQALPYVMTVVLLAGFIGTSVAPQALGRPYVKER